MNKIVVWKQVQIFAFEKLFWRFVFAHWKTTDGLYGKDLVFDITGLIKCKGVQLPAGSE